MDVLRATAPVSPHKCSAHSVSSSGINISSKTVCGSLTFVHIGSFSLCGAILTVMLFIQLMTHYHVICLTSIPSYFLLRGCRANVVAVTLWIGWIVASMLHTHWFQIVEVWALTGMVLKVVIISVWASLNLWVIFWRKHDNKTTKVSSLQLGGACRRLMKKSSHVLSVTMGFIHNQYARICEWTMHTVHSVPYINI